MEGTLDAFLHQALEPTVGARRGQYFMNTLYCFNQKLHAQLTGTDIDPFFVDDRVWAAIEFVKKNWDS